MKNKLFFTKFGDYLESLNGVSEEDIARSNYEHQRRCRDKQMHDSWLNVLGSLAKFLSSFSK
jgi:hypothetical protein